MNRNKMSVTVAYFCREGVDQREKIGRKKT